MHVRITSGGAPMTTEVRTSEGAVIQGVTAIRWSIAVGDISRAEVDLCFAEIGEIAAEARMLGPNGKEVRRIEYADGTVDEFPA